MREGKRSIGGKVCLCVYLCICLVTGSLFGGIHGIMAQAADKKVKVIGYLPSYRSYYIDSIDYSALTHLNLCFITYGNGTLSCDFSDSDIRRIKEKCKANNVKVMIALGGGSGFDASGGDPFETAEKRAAMVNELMGYVDRWELDGLDIDIEIEPGNAVWNHFDAFIAELSGRLKAENKLLTIAVATWMAHGISNSTFEYFDFVNLMTYDENAGNGPVASQSFVESTVNYFRGKGISDERLTIGVPFYGYGPGGWGDAHTYAEILTLNPDAASMDEYNGIYYNGADTIKSKAEYAKNFGGIMIWELAQDADGDASLLKAIKNTLGDMIGDSSEPEKPGEPEMPEKPSEGDNTEEEKPSEGDNSGNETYTAWTEGANYSVGDFVVYDGKVYECVIGHTAAINWMPDLAGTLWKERTDLAAEEKPDETERPSEVEKPDETEKPSEEEKPDETEKPSETEKPDNTERPSETEKSDNVPAPIIKVQKIDISGSIKKLAAGKKMQLSAAVSPHNASNNALIWKSSNEKYAQVDKNGLVSAKKTKKIRTVTITAAATDGSGVKQSYKLKIMPKAVKRITLKLPSKSVKAGRKIRIKAVVGPTKLVNTTLKYSSSNSKYATVTSKGIVKTKKAGKGKTVKITVMATDGSGKKKSIKIHIQ